MSHCAVTADEWRHLSRQAYDDYSQEQWERAERSALGNYWDLAGAMSDLDAGHEDKPGGGSWTSDDVLDRHGDFDSGSPAPALMAAILLGDDATALRARYALRDKLIAQLNESGRTQRHFDSITRDDLEMAA